jgi:hypothetical protein
LIGIGQHDVEHPLLVRADVGFDLWAVQVGVVAVFGPVGRVDVAIVDADVERLLRENRVLNLMQWRL